MKTIYFVDAQGKKVYVEVSDEVAAAYRDCQREEWRSDAYESYYATSLDAIIEAGHDFKEEQCERAALIEKLYAVLPCLTELQRKTIHKLFVLNMSQAEIAKEGKSIYRPLPTS